MNYGQKSRTGATILLCFITLVFMGIAGILSIKLSHQLQLLGELKSNIQTFQTNKEEQKMVLETYNEGVQSLQSEIETVKMDLQEAQSKYPELAKAMNENEPKYAYLTFDDGPSNNTSIILDFLKANQIKATFFVIGNEKFDEVYKRIVEEGHTLALHTNTHKYDEIYTSVNAFLEDIDTLSDHLEEVTGVKPDILRFPGGSNNTISVRYGGSDIMKQVIAEIEKQGLHYFDWNVDSSDASLKYPPKDLIVNSVLEGAEGKNRAFVLMHDATIKTTTVDALPEIVEGLRKQGFILDRITSDTVPVQFR